MNPELAARVIAEHFQANEIERAWIERVIRTVLPRSEDPTQPRWGRTDPAFPPPGSPAPLDSVTRTPGPLGRRVRP